MKLVENLDKLHFKLGVSPYNHLILRILILFMAVPALLFLSTAYIYLYPCILPFIIVFIHSTTKITAHIGLCKESVNGFIPLLYQTKQELISIQYETVSGSSDSSPTLKSYDYRKFPLCNTHTVQEFNGVAIAAQQALDLGFIHSY
jgi:hypothetical protein